MVVPEPPQSNTFAGSNPAGESLAMHNQMGLGHLVDSNAKVT